MHLIGTNAALAKTDELGGLSSHLPWGWFTLMAIVDAALLAVVVARRLQARSAVATAPRGRTASDPLVLRSGWWVPRSRALALPSHHVAYAWPLHREYMARRVV